MSNLVNPYAGAFGGSVDPPFGAVSLLLHMEGSNGGTSFTDSSSFAHTMSRAIATTSTAQSKFGSASALISTTATAADYISTPHSTDLQLDTGDFTLELWVYFTNTAANQILLTKASGTGFHPWQVWLNGSSKFAFRGFNNSSVSLYDIADSSSISTSQWYFVQARRSGNNFQLGVNGSQVATVTQSGTLFNSGSDPVVVGNFSQTASNSTRGHIDDVRITKGYALPFSNRGSQFPDS